jgi:hypothetical protein
MKKKIAVGLLLLVIGTLSVGGYLMHSMMQRGFSTRAEPMPMEKLGLAGWERPRPHGIYRTPILSNGLPHDHRRVG